MFGVDILNFSVLELKSEIWKIKKCQLKKKNKKKEFL